MDRPYFSLTHPQLREVATDGGPLSETGSSDRIGVLEELTERTSRGAAKLADELTGGPANASGVVKSRVRAFALQE